MRIATRAIPCTLTPITALEVESGLKPLKLRREELILKYWARPSPSGDKLPVNDILTEHGCYLTLLKEQTISGRIPGPPRN